jgi:hypothetical protein
MLMEFGRVAKGHLILTLSTRRRQELPAMAADDVASVSYGAA